MARWHRFGTLLLAALLWICGLAGCGTQTPEAKQYKVGLITNNPNGLRNVAGFKAELQALGYVAGENTTYLSAEGAVPKAKLDAALEAFVAENVDLIFTAGTPTGVAAHRVTADAGVPVVFGVIADPIAAGVMSDLRRPGGNMTGVMLSQTHGRRLELLLEVVPSVRTVFVPFNPNDSAPRSAVAEIEKAAALLNVAVVRGEVTGREQVPEVIEAMDEAVDAVFLVPDSTVNPRIKRVLEIAAKRRIPVSGPSTAQVEQGALMAYGFVHREAGAQAARMADQVLRGADPATLPVQTAEFFLALNLARAKALGIEVAPATLERAAVVVR